MTWLLANWRIPFYAAVLALLYYAGWHSHTLLDDARLSKELEQQQKQHEVDLATSNRISQDYESQLTTYRLQLQAITQQKEKALATGNPRDNCKLPTERLHVLTTAIAGRTTP